MTAATVQIDRDTGFFATGTCRLGVHCHTCRNLEAGLAFRTAIAAEFNLADANFDCPHGLSWDFDGEQESIPFTSRSHLRQPRPSPSSTDPAIDVEAKRRFAICKNCKHSRDDGFACDLHTGCCFGRWRSNPENNCPEGMWWEPGEERSQITKG